MKKLYDKQEIAPLLDKFMTGVSTADEEQVLEQYFLTQEVSKEWRVYKEMFALFNNGEVDIEMAQSSDFHTLQEK